jgi:small subunit ribosomal protein S20
MGRKYQKNYLPSVFLIDTLRSFLYYYRLIILRGETVAHTLQALKRIRQSEKRRMANKSAKSKMKTSVKKSLAAISAGDIEKAQETVNESVSVLYRTAGKKIIHKRQAARKVSRLVRKLNALRVQAAK